MSVLATDNFDRADGPLGANWGSVTGLIDGDIVSAAVHHHIGGNNGQRYTAVSAPDDHYAKVTVAGLSATSDEGPGPAVRIASGAETLYLAQANTTEVRLYKAVAGTYSQLGSDAGPAANGDVIELRAEGTSITVLKNGSPIIGPVTDSAITSGQFGWWIASTGADHSLDNWEGGDFGAGGVPFFARITAKRIG